MSELARAAGPVAALGLALLLVAPRRDLRIGGLVLWGAGMLGLVWYLAPSASTAKLAAAAVGGLVAAVVGAWLLLRYPWLLAFATLACIPARIPVKLGSEDANLLVPLYAVIGSLALAIAWKLVRGEDRVRELGPIAWPLAAFLLWSGLTLSWSTDLRKGAIYLGAFILPFGLLSIGFARLPWRGRWLTWLWAALVGTALAYAVVGGYQWVRRDVFWNPGVIVGNTYAPFFRVNSVFWDPSIYGRYLAVAILATLTGILLGGVARWKLVGLFAVVVATWCGLFLSYSQSSFVALASGVVVASAVVWGRRAVVGLVALAVLVGLSSLAFPSVRHDLIGHGRSGANAITSGRANLVSQGIRIAYHHPAIGVGAGGFKKAYAERTGLKGADPKRAASHTTPVTVAAEEGIPGLLLLVWLVLASLAATLLGLGRGFTSRVSLGAGLVLVAIGVHSLFYNAFFEDPMTWAVFGLVGLVARVPRKRPVTGSAPGAPALARGEEPGEREPGERIDEVGDLKDPAEEQQHEDGRGEAGAAEPDGALAELLADEERRDGQPDQGDEGEERVGAVAVGEHVRAEEQRGEPVADDAVRAGAVTDGVGPDVAGIGDQEGQETGGEHEEARSEGT
jgi:putative inorganic carbon (HCO3(-)) transporter